MLESNFQASLIRELKQLFPGCIVLKNDADYLQGVPDLLVLHGKYWASLECKKNSGQGDNRIRILCRTYGRYVILKIYLSREQGGSVR